MPITWGQHAVSVPAVPVLRRSTAGGVYALAALGFTLIYNASGVINFAQGEFVMIGGMAAVFLAAAGMPLPLAIVLAVAIAAVRRPADRKAGDRAGEERRGRDADHHHDRRRRLSCAAWCGVLLGKSNHSLPAFSGERRSQCCGATLLPQSLWVLGVTAGRGAAALAGSSAAR